MKKRFAILALSIISILCFTGSVSNATTIYFSPVSTTAYVGDFVSVDLMIRDLGVGTAPSVGTFDINVLYDPTIVGVASVTFGDSVLGDQLDIWGLGSITDDSTYTYPGNLNLFELSLDLADDLELLQADAFTLATIQFEALAVGRTDLIADVVALGDAWGLPLETGVEDGEIIVIAAPIPEPNAALIFALGGVLTAACSRKGA